MQWPDRNDFLSRNPKAPSASWLPDCNARAVLPGDTRIDTGGGLETARFAWIGDVARDAFAGCSPASNNVNILEQLVQKSEEELRSGQTEGDCSRGRHVNSVDTVMPETPVRVTACGLSATCILRPGLTAVCNAARLSTFYRHIAMNGGGRDLKNGAKQIELPRRVFVVPLETERVPGRIRPAHSVAHRCTPCPAPSCRPLCTTGRVRLAHRPRRPRLPRFMPSPTPAPGRHDPHPPAL